MRTDYLDHLSVTLRCSCLSDLRCRILTPDEARKLLSEPIDYPFPQYLEAVRYILLDKTLSVSTSQEAVQTIVSYMS